MGTGFAAIPDESTFVLGNARAPACLVDGAGLEPAQDDLTDLDLIIADGRIDGVARAGTAPRHLPRLEMASAITFPGFIEAHTHLDKGHIWPRQQNPDGTFPGALEAVSEDRAANWSAEDVRARIEFGLRSAYAHGTIAIRTHLDSVYGQELISWPVFRELRADWADRITLQAVSLASVETMVEDGYADHIGKIVGDAGGVLGCVTWNSPALDDGLAETFRVAEAFGLDLDFHVDETQDPDARSLQAIAQMAIERGFPGRIQAGHCCSITRQPADEQDRCLDLVAEAGIAVVSLPMCNLYLQERHQGRTPRYRGVTLLHEMRARGIPVSISSDNTRDPFYAYGDLDMLEVYREATRILHLDHPVGDWPAAVTATPADVLGLGGRGRIAPGAPADLVLFKARGWTELLSRPQSDRTVLRRGKAIDTTLPDYAELDAIVGMPGLASSADRTRRLRSA